MKFFKYYKRKKSVVKLNVLKEIYESFKNWKNDK